MKIFKCDGERFIDNKKCEQQKEAMPGEETPSMWLTISGRIKNDLHDKRVITANGELHFCSKTCLDYYLFKNQYNPQKQFKELKVKYDKAMQILHGVYNLCDDDIKEHNSILEIVEPFLHK